MFVVVYIFLCLTDFFQVTYSGKFFFFFTLLFFVIYFIAFYYAILLCVLSVFGFYFLFALSLASFLT